jgi:gliding motility-associated-like protein
MRLKKSLLCFLTICSSFAGICQEVEFVTEAQYASLKSSGSLTGNEVILSSGMVNPDEIQGVTYVQDIPAAKATGCSGYFDPPDAALDITWGLDDGSTDIINLPFTFSFFGDSYNSVYMNNNGNISFGASISSFSSTAFPSTGNSMIAAFWGDFDFNGGGTMHATVGSNVAIFNWVNAGYFSAQGDKRNTCQIVITDGTNPLVISGNVAIHYEDVDWTTGSASGGTNGFGGTPATCGANRGNNLDYFQIGRFDHAGLNYDGPGGVNDGVDWLDNKSFYFDFANTTNGNVSPIPLQTAYCDTFKVCSVNDTLVLSFPFLAPEIDQNTTVSFTSPTLTNVIEVSNIIASNGILTLQINGDDQTVGIHDLVITATDDFSTQGSTEVTYKIEIVNGVVPPFNFGTDFHLCPDEVTLDLEYADSAQLASFSWGLSNEALDTLFSASLTAGTYDVNLVSNLGCTNDTTFTVTTQDKIQLIFMDSICSDTAEMELNLGPLEGIWSYYNSAGIVNFRDDDSLNTGFSVSAYGLYNLVYSDLLCGDKDTLTITFIPNPYFEMVGESICEGMSHTIQPTIAYASFTDSYVWNTGETTTSITVSQEGYYTFTASNVCGDRIDSVYLDVKICDIEVPNVFTPNNDGDNDIFTVNDFDDIFTEFNMIIMNRWGSVVAEFNSSQTTWDGTDLKGNMVDDGVYLYSVTGITVSGEELKKQGFIQVIK